jgi:chemotaxis protein histidine kinase CheA
MTTPLGAADFFALEAGECLDRLEHLVAAQAPPAGDEFFRLARVLRGSALMASQTQIARAAAGLEALARAQRDHRRTWDPAAREQVAQAVEEFRFLVRQARQWTEADTVRAERLGRELETLAGRSPTESGASQLSPEPVRQDLHTGVRAFVAREGALIASALDRAARALRTSPEDREPLYNVIRRMQSLRGLAELGELAPLPDILDGIELAVGDLTRLFAPPPGVDEVIDAAARALTRISRDVAEHGRPDPDAEEAGRFTELLLRAFAVERDVVPIESLYFDQDTEPLSRATSQPQFVSPEPLGPLELVSQGEHLCQSADLIARARSATERDLRLYHLLGALRSAAAPSADPVAGALGIFARSAQEALAAGVASRSVEGLVSRLREAGELLRAVVETDDRMLISRRLLDVAYRLDQLRDQTVTEPTPAVPEEPPGEPVPIESLGFDSELQIVPIESLAPDQPHLSQQDSRGLELSFKTLGRLVRERGTVSPSLEVLLGRAADEPAVAIDVLCYRGHAALERAVALRHQITAELDRDASLESLQPLLQELLDLVPLALVDG